MVFIRRNECVVDACVCMLICLCAAAADAGGDFFWRFSVSLLYIFILTPNTFIYNILSTDIHFISLFQWLCCLLVCLFNEKKKSIGWWVTKHSSICFITSLTWINLFQILTFGKSLSFFSIYLRRNEANMCVCVSEQEQGRCIDKRKKEKRTQHIPMYRKAFSILVIKNDEI